MAQDNSDLDKKRIEVEITKLQLESEKIKKELKWGFGLSGIIKTIIIALASVTVLGFYFTMVIIPMTQADNIKLNLELSKKQLALDTLEKNLKDSINFLSNEKGNLKKERDKVTKEREELIKEKEKLFQQNKSLEIEKDKISKAYKLVEERNTNITKEYEKLATSSHLTETERDRYKQEVAKSQAEALKYYGLFAQISNEATSKARHTYVAGFSPDPFSGVTKLKYNLTDKCEVYLAIFNRSSNKLEKVISYADMKEAGWHEIEWDGTDQFGKALPDGGYLLKMRFGNFYRNDVPVLKKSQNK
jgi:hypothetical protein